MANQYPTDTIVCLSTGKSAVIKKIAEVRSSTFPEQWFSANKSKPTLNIPINNANLSPVVLRETVFNKLGGPIQVELAIEFPCSVLLTVKNSPWLSYNVRISEEGEVTPLDWIHQVQVKYSVTDSMTGTNRTSEKDNLWISLLLLSVYRLSKISDEVYRRKVSSVIEIQLTAHGCSASSLLNTTYSHNKDWLNNAEYRKVNAAVDMYFFKFDNSQWSVLCLGTTGSRYRDCAALLTYGHALRMIGATRPGERSRWIFCDTLAVEASRIFLESPNEEYASQHSYFPYQIDFGICQRSAYSARLNPAVHFFCNIIGVIYFSERSLNARMILD
ncbi:uncharacterized protein LOC118740743 [Rhagoletis pomonella]|uniref:uncharacterized protein LOC118740743 n=1 Tax=Rhagoletis pomonella TaxID=28610 RepID=UPI001782E4AD|nr:uncharacterized protein LOC118740743 [Rhagoletis pomonella]